MKHDFETFFDMPLDELLMRHQYEDATDRFWRLFQRCARDVPAYRAFLASHSVDADAITRKDFQSLPLMSKKDYMAAYSLPMRCFGGTLVGADRVAVSSGSTGQPTFWPRSAGYELEVAQRFEQVFRDSFQSHRYSTLAVVCFAMGNWVGGLFTTSCCWHLAQKGYPMLVATPGNNKAEILRVVKELAPHFQQTVLLGYPPFIKDVIDAGLAEGIAWAQFQLKLVFAGEVFSEEWRGLLSERIASKAPCFDSASMYGTADGGVLGNETPYSIAIRRWLAAHPQVAKAWFGESRLPTLVQYDPCSRFFEVHHDGTLVVSADNSVPLLRYHIADQGGLFSFDEMRELLNEHGVNVPSDLGLPADFEPRRLPFVFIFGRADFTVSFYGANIYPENVTVGLEQSAFTHWVSGKFVLQCQENEQGDKALSVVVELLPNVEAPAGLAEQLAEAIKTQLLRLNSEFAHYTPRERQLPEVSLREFADPEYFPAGVKHRYSRR